MSLKNTHIHLTVLKWNYCFFFPFTGAIWNSLNVDTDYYRAVYKNYTDENGRDFPMMIGRDIYYFDEVLRTKMIVRDLVLYLF